MMDSLRSVALQRRGVEAGGMAASMKGLEWRVDVLDAAADDRAITTTAVVADDACHGNERQWEGYGEPDVT